MCANRLGSSRTVDVGVEPQVIVQMERTALRSAVQVRCAIGLPNFYVAVRAIVVMAVYHTLPSITSVAPISQRCRTSCQGRRHQAEREDENEGERQNHP